jgi:hypothetical protein
MRSLLVLIAIGFTLSACAETVSVNRQMVVAALPPDCPLDLVQADMMDLSPLSTKWDFLGTVSVAANHGLNPADEEYRALIRPKACELGGTSVALTLSNSTAAPLGEGGALVYAVLRPNSAPAGPTKF